MAVRAASNCASLSPKLSRLAPSGSLAASSSTRCEVAFQRSKPRSNSATSASASLPGCMSANLCTR